MPFKCHHYAFDAAALLDECIGKLQATIDLAKTQRYDFLFDLKESLVTTECLLHGYFLQLLEIENFQSTDTINLPKSLSSAVAALRLALEAKKKAAASETDDASKQRRRQGRAKHISRHRRQETPFSMDLSREKPQIQASFPKDVLLDEEDSRLLDATWVQPDEQQPSLTAVSNDLHGLYTPSRNATDTLLFRLIVALQLCLVRIDDARFVITGRRHSQPPSATSRPYMVLAAAGVLGAGVTLLVRTKKSSTSFHSPHLLRAVAKLSTKAGIVILGAAWARASWNKHWMTNKIIDSAASFEEWQRQWLLVQSTSDNGSNNDLKGSRDKCTSSLDAKSKRLIEYALKDHPRASFWHSQGELRFLMLKRAMDIFYASVGTAVEAFHSTDDSQHTSSWQIPLASAAVASFYALTGGSERASQAIKFSAKDLIQNAWGMVSLPAIKRLSLEASKLLKRAAVADRIDIAGVSCFVLSRDPSPELSAALKRFHRKERRRTLSRLYTIDETAESAATLATTKIATPKKCGCPSRQLTGVTGRYRQRDVIFHLTGGGFFAHIIASDLPYLLDWSASTGAVVICPEYALLPEHAFPMALNQVTDVYSSLINGDAVQKLGFEVNRIIVTGESTGGNLAAAMCVKMSLQRQENYAISRGSSDDSGDSYQDAGVATMEDAKPEVNIEESKTVDSDVESISVPRLPDALMLSCAVLNLTLELTHSRVVGTEDPVLPSGLISVISDAYIPPGTFSKRDPLASPFFAPDDVLQWFPPTLLFASSNDPLLDDSVHFNQRLRRLGVESELRAAVNLPHAYWGLGTAGFPEAQQVQKECQDWLVHQLTRDRNEKA